MKRGRRIMKRTQGVAAGCLAPAVAGMLLVVGIGIVAAEAPRRLPPSPQATLPTPESALGFPVGADYHLATYDESLAYLKQLDAASDALQLVEVGRTSEGRPWYFALVSTPSNLAGLDRYREIAQRLAHPAGLTEAEARKLAAEGKAFVHIDGGLHASEVAAAQHTIQLAYDLVAHAGDPRIARILDNVIVMLWPSVNPDGQNIVVDWYRSNLGTPYEVAPLPRLYQKYIGHDNNRDAYMLNMIESRVLTRTWRAWEPQIIYVHHQTAPFPTRIWLPPFAEPIASQVNPLMSREVNAVGMLIAQALEERGQAGATHMGTGFDAWYPGYIDYLPMLKNSVAFWTETALYRYATPHFYTISDFPRDKAGLRSESLYPSPWKGGWWHLRDAVDYMLTASTAVLDYAARYKEELLYNRYQAGRGTIRKYAGQPPYAYLVPQDQRDPVAPVELLRRLAFNGLQISQLGAPATIEGERYPAGTWVIPMDQEFGELARQVLEVQHYPDLREYPEGPPEQPYDAAGWTLPDQMNVRVVAVATPLADEVRAGLAPVEGRTRDWHTDADTDAAPFDSVPGIGFDTDAVAAGVVPLRPPVAGSGPMLAVDPGQNNAFRAVNAAWRAGGTVTADARGRYVISGVADGMVDGWVSSLALRAERATAGGIRMTKPRIGLFRPWTASIDEGWTRWLLEQYGFEFSSLYNADVRAGDLRARYDVIVIADERARTITDGFQAGSVPPRYEGGIGEPGARALDEFVQQGGTLVCFNTSALFAIDALHLPVRNVAAGLRRDQFFLNGSILEVQVDTGHPIMAGMPGRAAVFVDRSPVFTTLPGFEGAALAKYQASGSPLRSGYLLGEKYLDGYAAALDVRHGRGHVILLGFRPQWRGQPFGTFKIVFASALFHGELADKATGTKGFWSPPADEPASSGEKK
jgi:hypothetical protein